MGKRLAVVFFGISYGVNLHDSQKNYLVDWRKSFINYREKLFEYMQTDQGFSTVEVFGSTYDNPTVHFLRTKYEIKRLLFSHKLPDKVVSRNECFLQAFDGFLIYCREEKVSYDTVIMIRWDLEIRKEFRDVAPIQYDRLNLVSALENTEYVCDNFYLFPFWLAQPLFNIFDRAPRTTMYHFLTADLLRLGPIHFLWNQPGRRVMALDFYRIVRTEWVHPPKGMLILLHGISLENDHFTRMVLPYYVNQGYHIEVHACMVMDPPSDLKVSAFTQVMPSTNDRGLAKRCITNLINNSAAQRKWQKIMVYPVGFQWPPGAVFSDFQVNEQDFNEIISPIPGGACTNMYVFPTKYFRRFMVQVSV